MNTLPDYTNVCIVGTGHVGLVVGAVLANCGINIVCVDKDENKIDALNRQEVPFYEVNLRKLLNRNVKQARLHFSTDMEGAIDRCQVIFIAVGTPSKADGRADLADFIRAALQIASTMKEYKVVVIKSTVPVGSARLLEKVIKENQLREVEFGVVSNPEFLRKGSAVRDFLHPDRLILGSDSASAIEIMKNFYSRIYRYEIPVITTNNETAEMIKYASNAMLALRISFINEIANLCDKVGADIYDVAQAMGMDKRIGLHFLRPGPGFGGPCLLKDLRALSWIAKDHDYRLRLGQAIIDVNEHQRTNIVKKAEEFFSSLKDKKVAVLGLAYKPNTDDTCESAALSIIRRLKISGAKVYVYDPAVAKSVNKIMKGARFCADVFTACKDAYLVIVATEWQEFRNLDFKKLKKLMAQPNIFDTRNMFNPVQFKELGYSYLSMGRGFHRSNPMC